MIMSKLTLDIVISEGYDEFCCSEAVVVSVTEKLFGDIADSRLQSVKKTEFMVRHLFSSLS